MANKRSPRVTIKNETGIGKDTKIFAADGTDITNELMLKRIELELDVNDVVMATMTSIAINGEVSAFVKDFRTEVVPPPSPKMEMRYYVERPVRHLGRMRSHWRLTLHTPLGDRGSRIDTLRQGWGPPRPEYRLAFVQE